MESLFDGCCRSTGNVDKETAVVEWDAARQDSSVEVTPSQKELVSCICGAVQVFISTEAAKRVLCHCEDCRRWTGSAGVMSAWYPRSEVVTRGELTSFRKHPKSTRLRKNCARCFSCLLVEHADPVVNILEICIGSMKQDLVKLDAHLFFSQPVLRMADQVNKFIDMPQILGGSGKLIREEDVWKDAPDGGSPSVEARCLCSAVRIKITGAPQFVGLCHCIDCRTWTGGVGHLAVVVPMEQASIQSGEFVNFEGTKVRIQDKGFRNNCSKCYSCVFSKHVDISGGTSIEICAGLFPKAFPLQAHMFYQQRIMSIKDGVPKLKDRPKELGGSGRRLVQDETPYSISLERPSDRSIGLEFQNEKCEGEAGRIASIEPGSLIDAWNKSGDPKRRVLVDDRLISVNGITASSDEEVRKLCKGIGKLHLMLARHMMVD
eukprot:TRINITY_DN27715_c0_g3_i2.p1 TRINITY_DN27715_c0_g3~~TRINITY_DN27715_c0_g3_i2.p1  ORF type:complete len:433 (+),score=73.25 TRINITY_DN27715_c0_g3_i2:44-1342(+)